jgi:hypothetical protein
MSFLISTDVRKQIIIWEMSILYRFENFTHNDVYTNAYLQSFSLEP